MLFPTGHPVKLRFARPSDTASLSRPPAVFALPPSQSVLRSPGPSVHHRSAGPPVLLSRSHHTPSLSLDPPVRRHHHPSSCSASLSLDPQLALVSFTHSVRGVSPAGPPVQHSRSSLAATLRNSPSAPPVLLSQSHHTASASLILDPRPLVALLDHQLAGTRHTHHFPVVSHSGDVRCLSSSLDVLLYSLGPRPCWYCSVLAGCPASLCWPVSATG